MFWIKKKLYYVAKLALDLNHETLNQGMEYEQTLKLKGKQKFARNKVKELFIYNTWDKSISVGGIEENFDIILSQVQLTFILYILDIQSMFWEPNCIWFGWMAITKWRCLHFCSTKANQQLHTKLACFIYTQNGLWG